MHKTEFSSELETGSQIFILHQDRLKPYILNSLSKKSLYCFIILAMGNENVWHMYDIWLCDETYLQSDHVHRKNHVITILFDSENLLVSILHSYCRSHRYLSFIYLRIITKYAVLTEILLEVYPTTDNTFLRSDIYDYLVKISGLILLQTKRCISTPYILQVWNHLPILNILVPQVVQMPWVAGLPFFIVTFFSSFIILFDLHLTQYASIFMQ